MTTPTSSARAAAKTLASVHRFSAPLWEMKSEGSWVFLTLPQEVADEIRSVPREPRPGFGSLRVEATIGSTVWRTSIFPESRSRSFVLPVKKAVRAAEAVDVPDTVDVTIELLD